MPWLLLWFLVGCAPSPLPPPPPPSSTQWILAFDDVAEGVSYLEYPATIVQGGSESYVLYETWHAPASWIGRTLDYVYTFNGLDGGDIVEMDTFVYDGRVPLLLDDEHKEVSSHFKAYERWDVDRVIRRGIRVDLVNRTNARNRANRLASRPHWGLYFVWK